jgi:putative FmdB family regulatory protein
MPIYAYVCKPCGTRFEALLRRMDAVKPPCPTCGRKRGVSRTIAGYTFIKDETTQMNEEHPKYAKMVDAAWNKASAADPISRTKGGRLVDSGCKLQDM